MDAIIEIHRAGRWWPAASLHGFDDTRCRIEYLTDYVFNDEAVPIALDMPVQFEPETFDDDGLPDRRPPPFLFDMVPQGRGRQLLVKLLKIADTDRTVMPLVMHGAFNPIGCLRISTAVDFYREQARKNPDDGTTQGFALADIAARSEEFLQHLSLHAMLASGTTGVQGVAPKFLLTQNAEGRWFADLALDDELADTHWLVKLPRGRSDEDLLVHRNEAAYLRVAAACGLRTQAEPMQVGSMLFLRRFDREVDARGLHRLHQESLASLAGLRGFGLPASQNELLAAMRRHVGDPLAETIEFLRRDVLNLALRNTDNHARNTAVQRLPAGTIQLTPLFDFAPMFLDPEVVPRTVQWRDAGGVRMIDWRQVIEGLPVPDDERVAIGQALKQFAGVVANLADTARDCGVEERVLSQCMRSIEAQARQLNDLPATAPPSDRKRRSRQHG